MYEEPRMMTAAPASLWPLTHWYCTARFSYFDFLTHTQNYIRLKCISENQITEGFSTHRFGLSSLVYSNWENGSLILSMLPYEDFPFQERRFPALATIRSDSVF